MNRLVRANHEKNIQMATLASMSDIYNSMHLIDLENNTIKEYNARKEISKVVSNTYGADESMKNIRDLTVEKEYYDDAAEFMDLHTMAERMQNKKIISEEFMSKAIGWYRASFIAIEADEEGYPTKVLYVTQNIDKQKRKEEELIIKSNTDGLTGFYNRMAYEEMVQAHHDIVMDEDFVYVSFDVNGLKPVNDNLGHAAGDELLIGAAACIKQCFGPYGRLYRIGGDEFIAIIFADELQLQRIKKDFDGVMKSWSGKHVKSLSISCGYVTKRETDANSIHMIAKIADKRMYEAKDEYYRITGLQRRMGNA
jgi:diguanylate cyclase (GGDEF)-like protein